MYTSIVQLSSTVKSVLSKPQQPLVKEGFKGNLSKIPPGAGSGPWEGQAACWQGYPRPGPHWSCKAFHSEPRHLANSSKVSDIRNLHGVKPASGFGTAGFCNCKVARVPYLTVQLPVFIAQNLSDLRFLCYFIYNPLTFSLLHLRKAKAVINSLFYGY